MDSRNRDEVGYSNSQNASETGLDNLTDFIEGLRSNRTIIESTPFFKYVIGFILAFMILTTLAGNCLVVLAVVNYRRLRTVTNCLIVSLATADIAVAVFVMPYSLIYEMVGKWKFGWIFCYFWISCDVMCCTASILHLGVISLDRYWAITEPLQYKRRMSRCRTTCLITGVWLCSCTISFIPIYLGWFADDVSILYKNQPSCGLAVNKVYAVISSMTSFYLPLIVMVFAYLRIFRIARYQAKEIYRMERSFRNHSDTGNNVNGKKKKPSHKDSKAIKTLGTIMGIFIISWLPFFLMYVILPFCESCYLPKEVESAITWLGYANSFINPCVYAFLNKDFNVAFRRLLSCPDRSFGDKKKIIIRYDRHGCLDGNSRSNSSMKTPKRLSPETPRGRSPARSPMIPEQRRNSVETAEVLLTSDLGVNKTHYINPNWTQSGR